MSNQFQDLYVDNLHPMPTSAQRITSYAGVVYANPWPSLGTGGPVTLNASQLLAGGLTAYFFTGGNVVTWPSVADIASELGMSTVTGFAFDYFVANNSQTQMDFILGAGMVLRSGDSLTIDPQSAGSFRFVGFDGGWNGQDLQMHVARIS